MQAEKLMAAVKFYNNLQQQDKSKYIFILEGINKKLLSFHQKCYSITIPEDEKPLMVINHNIPGTIGGRFGWSGMLLTDKKLYFKCLKDSCWSSLIPQTVTGVIPLEKVNSISLGDIDHCLGSAYIGHQLIINGKIVGLLRMGGSIPCDDKTIEGIVMIFGAAL